VAGVDEGWSCRYLDSVCSLRVEENGVDWFSTTKGMSAIVRFPEEHKPDDESVAW
jgi:hypothetical protein